MKPWEPGQTEAKVVPFNKEEVSEFFLMQECLFQIHLKELNFLTD